MGLKIGSASDTGAGGVRPLREPDLEGVDPGAAAVRP